MKKTKKWLVFFLAIICIILALCLLALQLEIYLTSWHSWVAFGLFATGLLTLNDLAQKNFFRNTSAFLDKILRWKNGKFELFFGVLIYIMFTLLLAGVVVLLRNL